MKERKQAFRSLFPPPVLPEAAAYCAMRMALSMSTATMRETPCITPPINVLSFGVYQFRISEMLNFLAFYNPKYIIGVTIGCMIANLFSSFGLIDVFVGGS